MALYDMSLSDILRKGISRVKEKRRGQTVRNSPRRPKVVPSCRGRSADQFNDDQGSRVCTAFAFHPGCLVQEVS